MSPSRGEMNAKRRFERNPGTGNSKDWRSPVVVPRGVSCPNKRSDRRKRSVSAAFRFRHYFAEHGFLMVEQFLERAMGLI